jgi:hypothetical protein
MMKKLLILLPLVLMACDDDRGARQDLPINNQELDKDTAKIFLMPDRFPNLAHKCEGTMGIWTTTDRHIWIVYNDPACDGVGNPFVLDNIPGAERNVTE